MCDKKGGNGKRLHLKIGISRMDAERATLRVRLTNLKGEFVGPCLRVTVDGKSKTKQRGRNQKYEPDTKLIQHDLRHRSVSVEGRLRHHQLQCGFAVRGRLQTAPR